jgi:hypothetical protein
MRTMKKYCYADSFAFNLAYIDQISEFNPLYWKQNYV